SNEPGSSFECRVDGQAFSSCTSPLTTATLGDGPHTFDVRAIDQANNVDQTPASRSFTVDTVTPGTTIDSGPTGPTGSTSASFAFSSNEPGSSFECKLDAGSFASCSSPQNYSSLSQGAHTFTVRAIDAAGNVDPSPATRSWTVDTLAPNTTIDSGPSGPTASTSASFAFSSDEPGSTFECKLDAGSFASCSSPQNYSSLSQGAHTFTVRAIDAAGNQDASPATRSWTVDTVAPNTTIDSGPSGPTASSTPTFGFSSDENGSTFECRVDSAPFAPCSSPFTTSTLTDGPHTFDVRAIDGAGNVDQTPAGRSFTVD